MPVRPAVAHLHLLAELSQFIAELFHRAVQVGDGRPEIGRARTGPVAHAVQFLQMAGRLFGQLVHPGRVQVIDGLGQVVPAILQFTQPDLTPGTARSAVADAPVGVGLPAAGRTLTAVPVVRAIGRPRRFAVRRFRRPLPARRAGALLGDGCEPGGEKSGGQAGPPQGA